MSGADFFIILIVVLFTWFGIHRGIIKEFFELLIVTVNVLICTHLYPYMSDMLVKYFNVSALSASTISFISFFLIFAFIMFVLSAKAEAAANLPPMNDFNLLGGGILSFLKIVVVIWALLFTIHFIPMTDEARLFFHDSFSVRQIQSLNPYVDEAFSSAGSKRAYQSLHPRIMESNL